MGANHVTQADIAARLGVTQSQVSSRLRGATRWSLDDLDVLWDMGVDIALPALAGWGGEDE